MAKKLDVRNPRSGKFDYQIILPSKKKLEKITQNLRQHQEHWAEMGVEGRIQVLQRWKQALIQHEQEIAEALAHDTGRMQESVLEAELLVKSIDRWCDIASEFLNQEVRKTASIPFIEIEQGLDPYALVGVISPWNFPLLLSIIDTLPALLAGCSVIVKPSEITPRFVEPILKTIEQVPELAPIFTYIQGDGETGARLVKMVDLLCFTGSVATGRKVYDSAARHFIPVFLELGGKDPAVVLASADLDDASSSLLWGSVVNAGQSCLSIERAYVEESVYEDFLNLLIPKAKALQLAYPAYDSGQIGPIISERQVHIIQKHLEDALKKGARILAGSGKIETHGGGSWLAPVVLTEVNHDMKIMTEETFGPILPVMPVKNKQEAIQWANSTIYGLSGSVFAGTNEEALEVAKQLQAGGISINEAALTSMVHEGEKNSFKASGIGGTRMGPSAIKRFMRQKAYLIKKEKLKSPWWFN